MVSKFSKENIIEIEELGLLINPKFKELFHIGNLSKLEEIYVYKEENIVLGFLHVLNNIDNIEIINIVTKEENRNNHIATYLLDFLLSEIDKPNILEVRESNIPAIKLYNKFNFFEISRRENYYGTEDAIIMERSNK